jgi:hypothetical protein
MRVSPPSAGRYRSLYRTDVARLDLNQTTQLVQYRTREQAVDSAPEQRSRSRAALLRRWRRFYKRSTDLGERANLKNLAIRAPIG